MYVLLSRDESGSIGNAGLIIALVFGFIAFVLIVIILARYYRQSHPSTWTRNTPQLSTLTPLRLLSSASSPPPRPPSPRIDPSEAIVAARAGRTIGRVRIAPPGSDGALIMLVRGIDALVPPASTTEHTVLSHPHSHGASEEHEDGCAECQQIRALREHYTREQVGQLQLQVSALAFYPAIQRVTMTALHEKNHHESTSAVQDSQPLIQDSLVSRDEGRSWPFPLRGGDAPIDSELPPPYTPSA